MMKHAAIFWGILCLLFLRAIPAQTSPLGDISGKMFDSDLDLELLGPGITDQDRLSMVDQLESVGIDYASFFDFSGESEEGRSSSGYAIEVYTGPIGGGRIPVSDMDRGGARFDRGLQFDEGSRFDRGGPAFDQRSGADKGTGFDSIGGFDRERVVRFRQESEQPSLLFRREESFQIRESEDNRLLTRERGGDRPGPGTTGDENGRDELTREKDRLEQDLLRSEELGIGSFRSTETGLFIRIAFFALALLLLLAGTLKGFIPLRFYFFLTILILILWNPMESLFISIIIGLSALLAPILG